LGEVALTGAAGPSGGGGGGRAPVTGVTAPSGGSSAAPGAPAPSGGEVAFAGPSGASGKEAVSGREAVSGTKSGKLPATGGPSLLVPIGAMLLVGSGLVGLVARRRSNS
jgi:LPXTG-motif cell wall-anchored protein